MEKAISFIGKAKGFLCSLAHLIGKSHFLAMAFFCFLLRILVKQPIGPLLALITGCVWAWCNVGTIRSFLKSLYGWSTTRFIGYEGKSLWFENEGQDEILRKIADLSTQGIHYCNLAEHINLPPQSHWLVIAKGLERQGVVTQISGDYFYLSWNHD